VCVCVCVSIYIHLYMYTYIYMCVYIYIERERYVCCVCVYVCMYVAHIFTTNNSTTCGCHDTHTRARSIGVHGVLQTAKRLFKLLERGQKGGLLKKKVSALAHVLRRVTVKNSIFLIKKEKKKKTKSQCPSTFLSRSYPCIHLLLS
jgi:hypothetical protein